MAGLPELNQAVQAAADDIESPELERAYRRAFLAIRPEAMARFKRVVSTQPVLVAAVGEAGPDWNVPDPDDLFTIPELEEEIHQHVGPTQAAVVNKYGSKFAEDVGSTWDVKNPLAKGVYAQLGTHITSVSETYRREIMTAVEDAWDRGLSIPHAAAQMSERIDGLSTTRAKLIARTELNTAKSGASLAAVQIANQEAYKAGEFYVAKYKEWLAANDSRTRHDHAVADGQRVHIDADFDVGGYPMQHPGDPRGPAKEVANCRCTLIYTNDPPGGEQAAHADSKTSPPPPEPPALEPLSPAQDPDLEHLLEQASYPPPAAAKPPKTPKAKPTKPVEPSVGRNSASAKQMALVTPDSGSYVESLSQPFNAVVERFNSGPATSILERVKPAYDPDFAIGGPQAMAVDTYKGSGYRPMNGILRGDKSATRALPAREKQTYIDAIEQFEPLTRAPSSALPEDAIFYRGFGLHVHPEPGDVLTDPGFMSVSASLETAEYFTASHEGRRPILLRIHARKGTAGFSYPGAGSYSELEFVLPPNSKVMIVGRAGTAGSPYSGETEVYDAVLLRADEVEG